MNGMTAMEAPVREEKAQRRQAVLFGWMLAGILGRAVLPNTIYLLTHGRPAPTVPIVIAGFPALVSSAFSLLTVVIALISLVVVRPSAARLKLVPIMWLVYLGYEVFVAARRGPITLSTAIVSALALLTFGWLEIEPDVAAWIALRLIAAVALLSLVLVVFKPEIAKYGDLVAAWFTRDARLAGPFSTPNEESDLFALGVVLAVGLWRRGNVRRPVFVPLGLALTCLVLTQSYTAWFAAVAGAIVAISARKGGGEARRGRGIQVALVAIAVYPLSRLLLYLDSAGSLTGLSGRRLVWNYVDQNWRGARFLGHGAMAWGSLITHGALPAWAVNGHDQLLDTLYIGGIVGVTILACTVGMMTGRAIRLWWGGTSLAFACVVLEIVRSYTEVPFEPLFGGLNLFVIAVILGLIARHDRAPVKGAE